MRYFFYTSDISFRYAIKVAFAVNCELRLLPVRVHFHCC